MLGKLIGRLWETGKRVGSKSVGGSRGQYDWCWACDLDKCGTGYDRRCACCRAGHGGR